jgi:hypothetical protein
MQPGPSGQRSGSACSSGKSRRVGICVIHRVDRFTSAPTLPTCRRFLDACLERCVKPARSTTSIGTFELFADNGSEMALRKGPSGARLQILLKTNRCFLSRELHRDDERPGPMMNGMTRRTAVVPFQPIADVRCDPDVVSRRIGVAAEDVDDSLLEAMHASRVTQGSGHMGVPAIPPTTHRRTQVSRRWNRGLVAGISTARSARSETASAWRGRRTPARRLNWLRGRNAGRNQRRAERWSPAVATRATARHASRDECSWRSRLRRPGRILTLTPPTWSKLSSG